MLNRHRNTIDLYVDPFIQRMSLIIQVVDRFNTHMAGLTIILNATINTYF